MNKVLKDKRASLILIIVCFIAYTILSFTRNAYTAAIAGIIKDGVFSKTDAGTINSSFYLTYSLAQILGSYFVDRYSPFKILPIGFIGTIISNIVMSMSSSFSVILIARAFSGLVQFGTWPALLKIVAEFICDDYRRKTLYIMPLGLPAGSILSFLISAIILDLGDWQDLFTISYILLGISTVVFFITINYANRKAEKITESIQNIKVDRPNQTASDRKDTWKLLLSSGAIILAFACLFKSLIAGIGSWMPTMIMESYSVSPGFANILTAIATLSNFTAVLCVALLYPRVFKSQPFAVGMFFVLLLPLLILLSFIGKLPLLLIVVLIIFINMFNNSIHQFFTVEIPSAYTVYNKAGMLAGFFNAFACIGSMFSGTVLGYVADHHGWTSTIILGAVLAFSGALISFASIPLWKKFIRKV